MRDVVWRKENYNWDEFPIYYVTIGYIRVRCTPALILPYDRDDLKRLVGWDFSFYVGSTHVANIITRKSLEAAKRDAEKAVIEHILIAGASMLAALKNTGMLKEAMSVAGID